MVVCSGFKMLRSYRVFISIQCFLLLTCIIQFSVGQSEKYFNGYIDFPNNLPNQPYVLEDDLLLIRHDTVQSPVLVVELALDALEGTQLRALGLLSVYGLNVTYAVRAPAHPLRPAVPAPLAPDDTCSALECRLLGHCYATHDYQRFFCSCFEGYTGSDCGVGPLCAGTANMCKHGGTCRQMGPAAVSCVCAPGYTGDLCEAQVSAPKCELEECSEGCRNTIQCDCSPKESDNALARFETRLQIMDQGNPNISQELFNQVTAYLKAYVVLEDEIEILNISFPDRSGERSVWVRIWAEKEAEEALRSTLDHFTAMRTSNDRVRLMPASLQLDMQPALSLLTLTVNQQRPEIWEGSEFILTCTAYGSPDISFTWYKDGLKINFNGTTRDIWSRTIPEDEVDQMTSVLEVSEARQIDSGRWSCAADDAGRRRCKAIHLTVLSPPDIRLLPSALTVSKGDNVSITCLTDARRSHGTLGFSWARDRTLLRLAPGREVWEDLYPAGSVLKLYNVQKSGEFRCQVSSVAGTNAKGVTMWALGANEEACDPDVSNGLRWPRTAPGAHASASCPSGYTGEVTRFCEPKTIQHGIKWRSPDFSDCVANTLKFIYEEFRRISFGYSWKSITNMTCQYESVLRSLPLHAGEGSVALHHTREILNYLLSAAATKRDRAGCVEFLLKIYDTLLKHPDNFLDEEKVYELQNALIETTGMSDNIELNLHEFSAISKAARDYNVASFKLQPVSTGNENWFITSAGVELVRGTRNAVIVAARYNNLAARLPSLKSSIEFKGGAELEFLIASQHIQLYATGVGVNPSLPHTVTLTFSHVYNYSAIVSKLACAFRSASEPSVWSTKACEVRIPEPTNVACQCRGLGTFALFTVARSTLTHTEKDLRGVVKVTVGVGGALCLAATALQMLGLLPSRKTRLPVLLKAATAGTHSAAMFTLLECDTRQEEACPGPLGWVCALCWCAGCAALCAQPLLLQQELAGRALHAPSVGLLAGVCTLAWLTARLWGGAPLQLGTAAQVVCAAGCALLVVLCFSLTVCAALRLRIITRKVPVERMKYLKDRRKVVRHTLVLLLTTTAVQAAGVAYAQPGERHTIHVAALAIAAIANGIAMMVCYVFCDEECLAAAKRALSVNPHRDWEEDSPAGDTSLSLYIKQGGEVDSRGGVDILETSPSHLSSVDSYWKAPGLESPDGMHRRQSEPDTRADIVRCVEYAECAVRHTRHVSHVGTTRAVCDLVPRAPSPADKPIHAFFEPPPILPVVPLLAQSIAATCPCSSSTPVTSELPVDQPIKSCLKKSDTADSTPSMEITEKPKFKSDIEQVNIEWNKAYNSPDTDKVLNKISSDLDFLLNRTLEKSKNVLEEVEEGPT